VALQAFEWAESRLSCATFDRQHARLRFRALSAIARRPSFHQGFRRSSRVVGTVNQEDSPFPQPLIRHAEEALLPALNQKTRKTYEHPYIMLYVFVRQSFRVLRSDHRNGCKTAANAPHVEASSYVCGSAVPHITLQLRRWIHWTPKIVRISVTLMSRLWRRALRWLG
jgi:hypothetical protein